MGCARLFSPRSRLLWFCLLPWLSSAQTPAFFQAQIDHFYELDQRDSFLHYCGRQLQGARAADSLARWTWTQVQIQDFFADQSAEALAATETALRSCWRRPRAEAEWKALLWLQCNRGYHLFRSGKVLAAVQAYEQVDSIYQRYHFSDFDAVESLYKPLGNHYTRLGDNEKALILFQKALPLAQGETETLAGLFNNIAIACWNQGNFPAATQYYRQGLSLNGLSPEKKGLLLAGLARTQLDEGQAGSALRSAQSALRLLLPKGENALRIREYRMRARLTAGLAALQTGQLATAAQNISGAEADASAVFGPALHRDKGKIALAAGALYRQQGRVLPAIEATNRALSAVLPGFAPHNPAENPAAATFYEENTIVEALRQKAQLSNLLFEQTGASTWLGCALECYELAARAENMLRAALQYQSSRLGLQNNTRYYAEAAVHIARRLYEKTGQVTYLHRAFALVEGSKAALLRDAVQQNLGAQRLNERDRRLQTLQTLRRNLAFIDKQLLLNPQHAQTAAWQQEKDVLIAQLHATEKTLREQYPAWFQAENGSDGRLPQPAAGTAVLAYLCTDTTLDVFVFTPNNTARWYRTAFDSSLQHTTGRFAGFFSGPDAILKNPAAYFDCAWALGRVLIPAEVADIPYLTLIPDGRLCLLPFDALLEAPPDAQTTLYNAPYALRKHIFRSAWSLAILQQQERLVSQAPHWLLGIAPMADTGVRGLAPLPASREEWKKISDRTVLQGAGATTAAFSAAAAKYRLLHLSTHAMAGASDEPSARIELWDQALLLPDIYALSLQADLVVLSACQTTLGITQQGEGVMSFSRAFAYSGAAAVIASLWTVNDRLTAQIMDRFYQNLSEAQTIAGALCHAKRAQLADPGTPPALQSPYFWAGLAMTGADKPLFDRNPWYCRPIVSILFLLGVGAVLCFFYKKSQLVRDNLNKYVKIK